MVFSSDFNENQRISMDFHWISMKLDQFPLFSIDFIENRRNSMKIHGFVFFWFWGIFGFPQGRAELVDPFVANRQFHPFYRKSGFSWIFNENPWISMKINGFLIFIDFPRFSVDFHRFLDDFHGFSRFFKDFHRFSSIFIDSNRFFNDFQ